MLDLTTSAAPPDAAPDITLIRVPLDVCHALSVGFGPTYAASSCPASNAVASCVPVLNGVTSSFTPLPSSLAKKPFATPMSAGAWVMFVWNPSRSTTGPPEPPGPVGLADDVEQPAAMADVAAIPAAAPGATSARPIMPPVAAPLPRFSPTIPSKYLYYPH